LIVLFEFYLCEYIRRDLFVLYIFKFDVKKFQFFFKCLQEGIKNSQNRIFSTFMSNTALYFVKYGWEVLKDTNLLLAQVCAVFWVVDGSWNSPHFEWNKKPQSLGTSVDAVETIWQKITLNCSQKISLNTRKLDKKITFC
jgi:hypothetical protein